ncbi:MAG TPA: nuclear transport factor 2 family protein [Nocardioides sp.]|uniref:nuclear transport factor 2 family protein n=1 Tax=Nocardioides sp. TaxID=35761 RepID=UPI002E31E422|nr:nuclear transport factor 2 family protein [Nocardioides sp.]HEX5090829.1 nuclear transport factor 2 family protein [Nocardioides sp.]
MRSEHESLVRNLLDAIARDVPAEEVAAYWHPEAEQIEYPSVMRPRGHTRGLAEMLDGYQAGSGLLRQQRYDVRNVVDDGAQVAVQLTWTATTALDAGPLPAGSELVAHVAIFYEFRDGRILRQSSYDCYEPVPALA